MHVFMLGWEFPPFISGGLGTACAGITKALSAQGVQVTFVLPKAVDGEYEDHVRMLTPQSPEAASGRRWPEDVASSFQLDPYLPVGGESEAGDEEPFSNVAFKAVPVFSMYDPYLRPEDQPRVERVDDRTPGRPMSGRRDTVGRSPGPAGTPPPGDAMSGHMLSQAEYAGDLFKEVRRYAALCLALTSRLQSARRSAKRGLASGGAGASAGSRVGPGAAGAGEADATTGATTEAGGLATMDDFDLVHAHDWMTLPAAMAIHAVSGKPFIAHIHSTEFDRADEHSGPNQAICDIERRGLHMAQKVFTVSQRTKDLIVQRYAVPADRVHVVYNGLDSAAAPMPDPRTNPWLKADAQQPMVLFLGRVTAQKGPLPFVDAARVVAERVPKARFVIAGDGDQLPAVRERIEQIGLSERFIVTGFLEGAAVAQAMSAADVFVMPSVNEPFGIAALEAIQHRTPVIISRDAGVGEVVRDVLRCNPGDVSHLSELIISVLERPPLSEELRENAAKAVRGMTWQRAAERIVDHSRTLLSA